MSLKLSITGEGLERFEECVRILGEKKARRVFARALNEAGRDAKTPTQRALAKQTGLKVNVTRRALRVSKATSEKLEFVLTGRGGDIGLKYFAAREVKSGVSAAPFGKRKIFDVHFTRGGHFPSRKTLAMGGHVFRPHTNRVSRKWGRPIEKAKSNVYIPKEMVNDATRKEFESFAPSRLQKSIERHIRLTTKNLIT